MHEIDENGERTAQARALDGETAGPGPDEAWRPDDRPPLGGSFPGADETAWSSPEAAPTADVVPTFGRPAADPRSFVGPESTPSRGLRNPAIPSLAAIAGHPIHPMLVALPIGAFTGALVSDMAYAATGDRFWARASSVLLGAGIATGTLAGAVGSVDFAGRERVREHGESWLHAGGNVAALAIGALNLAIRRPDVTKHVVPAGLALSAVTGTVLLATGWFGGELVFRHRIGVSQD